MAIVIGVSLWSISLFANSCSTIDSPIALDASYNQAMDNLVNKLSVESNSQANLRQTLPMDTNPCVVVSLKNHAGDSLRIVLTHDLLFHGFITKDNHYFYFSNAKVLSVDGAESNTNLRFSNSNNALGTGSLELSADSISKAITNISVFNGNSNRELKQDMARIMFVSTEAIKFRSINNIVIAMLNDKNQTVMWNNYNRSINNWIGLSNKAKVNGIIVASNPQDGIGTKNDIRVAMGR